jgi:hypothetical protein
MRWCLQAGGRNITLMYVSRFHQWAEVEEAELRSLRFLWLWLTLGWAGVALIIYLSLVPSPPDIISAPSADKLGHLLAYAFLMTWFGFVYLPSRAYRNLGLGFIVMGLVLELVQGALGYRSPEYLDMLANGLGVLLGWMLAKTRLATSLVRLENLLHTPQS